MAEKLGIKESQELLVGILKVAQVLGPILKDGFQAGQDLPALFAQFATNEELKAAMSAAVDKSNQVPAEVKDLDAVEVVQLLTASLPELIKVLDAWKK